MAANYEAGEAAADLDLGALLDAGDGAVVTLVAGDGTRLAAHRAVLAASSHGFAAIFCRDAPEAAGDPVDVPDVAGPVLRQLLAYAYTLRVPQLPGAAAARLLAAADAYGLPVLKDACEQQVVAGLSVETAAASAALAVRHSCPWLKEATVAFIKAHSFQVMASQGWAEVMLRQPQDLVEVSQLLCEPPPETSAPAAAGGEPAPAAGSQRSGERSPPASAAPPDDAAVSRVRGLSGDEKSKRLIQAAQQGAVTDLQVLLAAGADVQATDKDLLRNTALHWAALRGHVEAVRCMVEGGADVETTNRARNTPLLLAAMRGHAAVVRLLLEHAADPTARDQNGWTPLHWAASKGHTQVATALLEAGADRVARTLNRDTPLDLARLGSHHELIDMLT